MLWHSSWNSRHLVRLAQTMSSSLIARVRDKVSSIIFGKSSIAQCLM
jgi:hypothetical protein